MPRDRAAELGWLSRGEQSGELYIGMSIEGCDGLWRYEPERSDCRALRNIRRDDPTECVHAPASISGHGGAYCCDGPSAAFPPAAGALAVAAFAACTLASDLLKRWRNPRSSELSEPIWYMASVIAQVSPCGVSST